MAEVMARVRIRCRSMSRSNLGEGSLDSSVSRFFPVLRPLSCTSERNARIERLLTNRSSSTSTPSLESSSTHIADTLKAHFESWSLVVVEWFHFHKRDQASGETVANYIAELYRLASKFLIRRLCGRSAYRSLCVWVEEKAIQRKLLSEVELTFSKAVEIACSMEAEQRNAHVMKSSAIAVDLVDQTSTSTDDTGGEATTNKKERGQHTVSKRPCHRCGCVGHSGSECACKNMKCHKCGKMGHLARVCRSVSDSGRAGGLGET